MASIRKLPSKLDSEGRRKPAVWRARYRDESGKEHARHFERQADAQRWLDEVTAALVTGQYVDPSAGRITFAAYFEQWAARQVWENTTDLAMRLAARSVTFSDVPLARLRRSHLEGWVKTMAVAGLAPGTIRTRTNNVRAVLRGAVRDRVLAHDPSDGLTLPRDRRREAAMVLPSVEQVGALLNAAAPAFQAFVAVASFGGLRLGEAAALQVADVDFLRRSVHVRRQVQRAGGAAVEVRPPKYGSERTVFVPDALLELLSGHISEHRTEGQPQRWLFVTSSGQPLHQNTVGYHWRQTCQRAEVQGVTLHDLRHFYASALIAAGCDVVTVQRALGHAKATTTLNTYAHLWPTAEDRTRAAAADLMLAVRAPADSVRTQQAPYVL